MPDASKTNRRSQVFFVNGRWVKSKVLDSALEAAYSDKMFEASYNASVDAGVKNPYEEAATFSTDSLKK